MCQRRALGLMYRTQLAADAGMLFDFKRDQDVAMWMRNTRIPLDIAFLDSAGIVRATRAMVPCEAILAQGCPTYSPDVTYRYALEVNSGYFQRHQIAVGSVAVLSDLASSRHAGAR